MSDGEKLIELEGRVGGVETFRVTKKEILTAVNKSAAFILAIMDVDPDEAPKLVSVRRPVSRSRPIAA